MINKSDVTIIIPHYGNSAQAEHALDQCLDSLWDTAPEIKVIVASNGKKCTQRQDHEQHHSNTEFMILDAQGQCKAVNAAVAITDTPWIFITNDDMMYAPDWFHRLQTLGTGPHVSIDIAEFSCVSPKLVEPRPGAPTFDVFFAGGAGGDFDREKWLAYAAEYNQKWYRERWGFNLPFLIKRNLWDLVGGYDIKYDPWGSNGDSDLEYKIKLAGVQPYQNTSCIVYHFSQTSGTFEPQNDSYRFRNYAYFKEKWGFDRTDDGIWEATFLIPTKEEGRIYFPEFEGKYAY